MHPKILSFCFLFQNNDEENWPQGMCETCVSGALSAYTFKLNCLKANATLAQVHTMQSSPLNMHRSDDDAIDINVVYQDHEYDVPLFSNHPSLDFESKTSENNELTPLPPISEITSSEQHMRKESEKKYACTICPRSFTRIYGLRAHMERHADVCRHLCPKCGKGFHTSSGLKQHLHTHKAVGQFKCGICNKNYKSRQSLKEHFRVAHSSNCHLYVCTLCGKSFTAKSTLLAHIKIHNGARLFACPECPKTYTRASYLRMHKLIHSGLARPRPHACNREKCDRTFTTKYSLLVHIAHTHSSERPFKCEICSKCFATFSGLKGHKESHCMKKDISCDVCGKHLANKRVMHKHLRSHNIDVDSRDDMMTETIINDAFLDHLY